ncbi:putative leucine-rich repeat-containing protein [Aphis craccivora]|uniref:Putative leucine-rich repeat-containing protein n=1 Tax=Aphis craccivora TaxID=307492 RepID=A0A6G0Y768_APHCR|nr:putative leucine-rich repeat-containing protein [Aphis craccivora]
MVTVDDTVPVEGTESRTLLRDPVGWLDPDVTVSQQPAPQPVDIHRGLEERQTGFATIDESELLLISTDIPNVMPDNLTCAIDTMEELQKYIDTKFESMKHEQIKLVIEKWQSDTTRLIITMGIHQKEQLQYLENIQHIVNTASVTSISNDINKEEDIIYIKFPITSLETINELDNEVKQLKLLKVVVYDSLIKNLSLIGGSSIGELLRRILKKILTDEIAEQYCWFGRQKKN